MLSGRIVRGGDHSGQCFPSQVVGRLSLQVAEKLLSAPIVVLSRKHADGFPQVPPQFGGFAVGDIETRQQTIGPGRIEAHVL